MAAPVLSFPAILFGVHMTLAWITSGSVAGDPDLEGMYFQQVKDQAPVHGTSLGPVQVLARRWDCLRLCHDDPECASVVWTTDSGLCDTYAEYRSELVFEVQPGTTLYSKRPCRQYRVYDNITWGAESPNGVPVALTFPLSFVVVHHTAGSRGDNWPADCGDLASCFQAMRDIQHWDMNVRNPGWEDIAVNFFLDGSGRVFAGRGWTNEAAYWSKVSRGGVQGYGHHVALTVFGDFQNQYPTEQCRVSLRAFCACAVEEGRLTRQYTVLGHVEDKPFSSYVCPGDSMLDMLHKWPLIFR